MTSTTEEQRRIFRVLQRQINQWAAVKYEAPGLDTPLTLLHSHINYYKIKHLRVAGAYGDVIDTPTLNQNAGIILEVRFGDNRFSTKWWGSNGQMPLGNVEQALEHPIHNLYDLTIKEGMGNYLTSRGRKISFVDQGHIGEHWVSQPPRFHTGKGREIDLDPDLLSDIVKKASAELLARRSDLIEPTAFFQIAREERFFVDSEGSKIYTCEPRGSFHIGSHFRTREGYIDASGEVEFSTDLADLVDQKRIKRMIDILLEKISVLENAEREQSGHATVILGPGAFGVYLHEAILAHLLSAEYMDRGASTVFSDSLGEVICPEFLSVQEDPTLPSYWGSYKYDYEGMPARPTQVIEKGRLLSLLHTRATAARRGIQPSGNSRGQYAPTHDNNGNFVRPAYEPRSSNIVVRVDPESVVTEEELIEQAHRIKNNKKYVLYIESPFGGRVDVRTGLFTLAPDRIVRIYEDGRRVPVTGAELTGIPHIMLENIVQCGDNYETEKAVCSANSGLIPASTTAPSALISRMDVTKVAKERFTPPLLDYKA